MEVRTLLGLLHGLPLLSIGFDAILLNLGLVLHNQSLVAKISSHCLVDFREVGSYECPSFVVEVEEHIAQVAIVCIDGIEEGILAEVVNA
jgi:hypothetical protein